MACTRILIVAAVAVGGLSALPLEPAGAATVCRAFEDARVSDQDIDNSRYRERDVVLGVPRAGAAGAVEVSFDPLHRGAGCA